MSNDEQSEDFKGETISLSAALTLMIIPWNSTRVNLAYIRSRFEGTDQDLETNLLWLQEHNLVSFLDDKRYQTTRLGFEVLDVINHIQENHKEKLDDIIKAFLFNKEDYDFKWKRAQLTQDGI